MLWIGRKNKQFYKITLTDCAIPSFCSGGKDYYGTIEEVEDLITAIKNNNSIESDIDGLQAAFTEYKSGNIECEHTVAYSKAKFLTSVRLIAENEMTVDKYKWKHINIWHCPCYMHAGISHFKQVVLQDGGNYIRAIKPQFCELRCAIEEQSESQDKIGVMFWGVPEMIKYDSRTKKTLSRLYLYEERYSDKATACRDLDNAEKINLRSFCDDIFGDG